MGYGVGNQIRLLIQRRTRSDQLDLCTRIRCRDYSCVRANLSTCLKVDNTENEIVVVGRQEPSLGRQFDDHVSGVTELVGVKVLIRQHHRLSGTYRTQIEGGCAQESERFRFDVDLDSERPRLRPCGQEDTKDDR